MTLPTGPAIRSKLDQLVWPGLPSPEGNQLLALLYQLEQSQWWSAETLWQYQCLQLQSLLMHAYRTVPFYQQQWQAIGFDPTTPLTPTLWQSLPLLTRQTLRQAGATLNSQQVPKAHEPLGINQTSGSTGEPVKIYSTGLTNLFWQVLTLRDHQWHRRDFSGKLAVIRFLETPANTSADTQGQVFANWGNPVSLLYLTGTAVALNLKTDIKAQLTWLIQEMPDYLLTYPSNLSALLDYSEQKGIRLPHLKEVRTIGEMLPSTLRADCRRVWGVPIVDAYSSQEMGYMALQCPESDAYHVQSETVLLEVLNEQNQPCQPGEIGRIVVTSLHNFATPLIRYEIQDYAEMGSVCPCGRGLMCLERIVGRQRNLVTLPTGEKYWPLTGFKKFNDIAPIRQYQLVQKSLTTIQVRFVTERPLSAEEENQLQSLIQRALGHPFELIFTYFDDLPKKANGKFEEFISELE